MWRAIIQKGAAAGTAGLASMPGVAQCRAPSATASEPVRLQKDGAVALSSAEGICTQEASEVWLAPDFKEGEHLGWDEVSDALSDVLSVASGRARPAAFELADDGSSVESFGAEADSHIEASDAGSALPPEQLSAVMHRLLNNADVQRAVMGALRDSPEFGDLLDAPELERIKPLYASQLLLPATAAAALEHQPPPRRNPLEQGLHGLEGLAAALASGLESGVEAVAAAFAALGANIAGVSDGIGRCIARLAADARAALRGNLEGAGRAAAAGDDASGKPRNSRGQVVAGTLFTIAVAVIAMVLFKRAKLVRIVRV